MGYQLSIAGFFTSGICCLGVSKVSTIVIGKFVSTTTSLDKVVYSY